MRVEQIRYAGSWHDRTDTASATDLWQHLPAKRRRIVYRTDDPAMSYDAIQYHADIADSTLNGWYIVSYDADGTSFDAVGTYDTIEDAERIYLQTKR